MRARLRELEALRNVARAAEQLWPQTELSEGYAELHNALGDALLELENCSMDLKSEDP